MSVKFLSKTVSCKLELHTLHLSKTYNLKKRVDFVCFWLYVPLHFDYLHSTKNPMAFVSGTPHVSREWHNHGTRFPSFQGVDSCLINIQGGSVPQVPWFDTNPRKTKTVWFEPLEVCWFVFFPFKNKCPNKTRNGTCKKEGVFERKCQLEESCKVWQTEK